MSEKKLMSSLIASVSTGDFDVTATRELTKAVEAVEAGHGNASVVIKLTIKKDGRMVVVAPTVKATVPVAAVPKQMFFVSARGELTEDDPKQTVLALPKQPGRVITMDGNKPKPQPQAMPKDGDATNEGKDA